MPTDKRGQGRASEYDAQLSLGIAIPRRGASWIHETYNLSGRLRLTAAVEQELNWWTVLFSGEALGLRILGLVLKVLRLLV